MNRVLGGALVVLAISCGVASQAKAATIDESGSRHDGAFFKVSVTELIDQKTKKPRATVAEFTLECRKNWSGRRRGIASASLVDINTGSMQNFDVKCDAHGPGDAGTTRDIDEKRFTFPGQNASEVKLAHCIVYKFSAKSDDWTQDTRNQIDKAFKDMTASFKIKPFGSKDSFKEGVKGTGLDQYCL